MARLPMLLLTDVASDLKGRCSELSALHRMAIALLALLIVSEPRQAIFASLGALCFGLVQICNVELRRSAQPHAMGSHGPHKEAAAAVSFHEDAEAEVSSCDRASVKKPSVTSLEDFHATTGN